MFAIISARPLLTLFAMLLACGALAQTESSSDPATEGPKVITEAFGKLSAALSEAVAKDGPAGALTVCSEKAPQIAKEVAAAHGVTLRRATNKPRNPNNAVDAFENAVLKTFAAALEKNEAPKPQILPLPDGGKSFFAPIILGNPLCLQCHGDREKDITPETLAAIQKLYPADKATGFQLGDLRGLWRVTFPAVQ